MPGCRQPLERPIASEATGAPSPEPCSNTARSSISIERPDTGIGRAWLHGWREADAVHYAREAPSYEWPELSMKESISPGCPVGAGGLRGTASR